MFKRQRRYPREEIARRGSDLYESKIRSLVEGANLGRILCIDIETGDYAIADDERDASEALIEKNPDAQIWCLRIGHIAVDKYGPFDTREKR